MFKLHHHAQVRTGDQRGINMVDLMMWLVIAALLLAAALQSIGYYQKTAMVYQLSSDLSGAGQNIIAQASIGNGAVTTAVATEGIANTKLTRPDTRLTPEVRPDGYFTIESYSPALNGYRVVYSSDSRDGLKTGVNLIPLAAGEVNPGQLAPSIMGTTNAAVDSTGWSGYGGSNGGSQTLTRIATGGPTSELPAFMRMKWDTPLVGGPNGPNIKYYKDPAAVEAGKTYEVAAWMRSNQPVRAGIATYFNDSSGNAIVANWHDFTLPADTWVLQKKTWTAPAGSKFVGVMPHIKEGVSLPAGTTFDVIGVTVREVR